MKEVIENIKKTLLDAIFPSAKLPNQIIKYGTTEIKKPNDWCDENTIVMFDYGDKQAKSLIWELKYKNNSAAAEVLAEAMREELIGAASDWAIFDNFQKPVLLPVPLSKKKLAKRGYNQTEILVRKIMRIDDGKNFEADFDVLKKVKETKDQSSLKTKTARLKNLRDCFKVTAPEKIQDRNIIIIDDVITTGATLSEIRKALKQAGAGKIKAIVVAH